METTRIESRIGVRASADRIWELLSDLDHWSRWNPYETDVSGQLLVSGGSISLTESLPGFAPRQVTAPLGDWQPLTKLLWSERRGFLFQSTRYFTINQLDTHSAIVSHGTVFSGLRGELYHDKHRRQIRQAYDAISEQLKAAAEADGL